MYDNKWKIRLATSEDVPRILEIYAYYVENTSISFEYKAPSLEEFKVRYSEISKKYPYLVVEENGVIEGYAYANTFKAREAYNWSVEVSIYLDKESRGKGKGQALYTELEQYLKRQNIINANACVTYPNPGSMAFHKKMGFKEVAHFHECGYKFNEWHDMIWLEKSIGEHKLDMPNVIWFEDL